MFLKLLAHDQIREDLTSFPMIINTATNFKPPAQILRQVQSQIQRILVQSRRGPCIVDSGGIFHADDPLDILFVTPSGAANTETY